MRTVATGAVSSVRVTVGAKQEQTVRRSTIQKFWGPLTCWALSALGLPPPGRYGTGPRQNVVVYYLGT